jgi:predicted DNA-binding WGR domain protein
MPSIRINETKLFVQDGTSDKVYHCWIERDGALTDDGYNGWTVCFEYGRRGNTMTFGTKITGTTKMYAQKVLQDLIASKKKKGYQEEKSGQAFGKLDGAAATPKQIAVLKATGMAIPPGLSKQQASWMIDNSAQALKLIAQKAEKAKPIEVVWPTWPFNQYAPSAVKSESVTTTRRIKEMDE